MVVLTDEPADFADLPVRAIRHAPTGPMAVDYLQRLAPTGNSRGAAAYHDKRFAIRAALETSTPRSSSMPTRASTPLPPVGAFPPGLAVLPVVRSSIAEHLETCGPWRLPAFAELARELMGDPDALRRGALVPRDVLRRDQGWTRSAVLRRLGAWRRFHAAPGVYSGEGGVMGLAALCAGWTADYDALVCVDADAFATKAGGRRTREPTT